MGAINPGKTTKSRRSSKSTNAVNDNTVSVHMEGSADVIVESGAAPMMGADVVIEETINADATVQGAGTDESGLTELLAQLETDTTVTDSPVATVISAGTDADVLAAAVSSAEAVEASLSVATPDGVVESSATPTGDASDVTTTTDAKTKKVPVPRKHYSDKVERLKDRMGDNLAGFTVLTMDQADVTDDELKEVMAATLQIIKDMNKKQQARASMFIEWLAGKKAKPNEILSRAFKVLERDGYISTGNEGNLFKDLLAKPYAAGAARAMGGNTIGMLHDLKVLQGDGKQKFVANTESLLLAKARQLLTVPATTDDTAAAAA